MGRPDYNRQLQSCVSFMRIIYHCSVLILFLVTPLHRPAAQITIGNCNIISSPKIESSGQFQINVEDFGCPQDPKQVLRIAYYWLDSTAFSFLISGQNDPRLHSLLGDRPILVSNDVLKEIKFLIQNFGSSIDAYPTGSSGYTISVRAGSHTAEHGPDDFRPPGPRRSQRMRARGRSTTLTTKP
jgi:hypothetical protein